MATALEGASVTRQAGGVSSALAGPATRQAAAPANRIAPERRKDRVRLIVPPVHVRGSSGERAARSAAPGGGLDDRAERTRPHLKSKHSARIRLPVSP